MENRKKKVNFYMNEPDITSIKLKIDETGLSFSSFVNHVLSKYATSEAKQLRANKKRNDIELERRRQEIIEIKRLNKERSEHEKNRYK